MTGITPDRITVWQDRLRRKMQALTGGDATRPIIVLGWNAEHWGSRNLALRLVALGYTRVHWYRGGKEVWEDAAMCKALIVLWEVSDRICCKRLHPLLPGLVDAMERHGHLLATAVGRTRRRDRQHGAAG